MNITKNFTYWLFGILALGLLLRIVSINQSLWMDESISAYFAKNFSYLQIIGDAIKSDTHPPFYYLLLKFWTDVFGYSELSLRIPSVAFGTATILIVFAITRQLSTNLKIKSKDKFTLFAILMTAFSPLHVYYSQEARMYSLTIFLVMIA